MTAQLIQILKRENIQYVVAPYEADAQLVYLEKTKVISAIISEDSDLLVFGAQNLLTKMDDQGMCISVSRSKFKYCTDLFLGDLTDTQFRALALFSGCDYSNGIPGIGLKKAHFYIRKCGVPERALRCIRNDGFKVPLDFEKEFEQGDTTFQYQRVYSITEKRMVMLNEPIMKLSSEAHIYIGKLLDDETAQGIAIGYLDPFTKTPIEIPNMSQIPSFAIHSTSLPLSSSTSTSSFKAKASQPLSVSSSSKITSFFSNSSPSAFSSRSTISSPLFRNNSPPTMRATSLYSPKIPIIFSQRPVNRSMTDIFSSPSQSVMRRSLIKQRANKYLGPSDSESSDVDSDSGDSTPYSSQTTLTDSPPIFMESTTKDKSSEQFKSAPVSSQPKDKHVSKFFLNVASRSSNGAETTIVEDHEEVIYSDNELEDHKPNQISSGLLKYSYKPESSKAASEKETSRRSSLPDKTSYLWTKSAGIKFDTSRSIKGSERLIQDESYESHKEEKFTHLKKLAYKSPSIGVKPSPIRMPFTDDNILKKTPPDKSRGITRIFQTAPHERSYGFISSGTPGPVCRPATVQAINCGDGRTEAGVGVRSNSIDSDSDSSSSEVETPKHMRVSNESRIKSNIHLLSPTRKKTNKRTRVSPKKDPGTLLNIYPSEESLTRISEKLSQFSYIPNKP